MNRREATMLTMTHSPKRTAANRSWLLRCAISTSSCARASSSRYCTAAKASTWWSYCSHWHCTL